MGEPLPEELRPDPGTWPAGEEDYIAKLRRFIIDREYDGKLHWRSDFRWRLTGPFNRCPSVEEGQCKGASGGVHPAVKIYYSPEVTGWLCEGRKGALPDGAMIVKEMAEITDIGVDPKSKKMWLPQDVYETLDPDEFSWTIMVKAEDGAADGWFWANPAAAWTGNPPIVGRSASNVDDYFDSLQNLIDHDPGYYPTGNAAQGKEKRRGLAVYPYYGFGNYCINCHASATGEQTFSNLGTFTGDEIEYLYDGTPEASAPLVARTRHLGATPQDAEPDLAVSASRVPYSKPLTEPDPDFSRTFKQFRTVRFDEVVESRLPAETYDHAVSRKLGGRQEQFVTSDQCLQCHDAGFDRMLGENPDGTTANLSPWAEWRASPMGLAGRDPIFYAQLESETNRMPRRQACIENTCLSCHGAMGQRQLAIDGGDGAGARCEDMLPTKAKRLFSRSMMAAWRDHDPANAKYGGLGRDGISCAVCHHISDEGLGTKSTFTGQFHVGPADEIFGPYKDPKVKPMEHALGLTPKYAAHMRKAELCGTCHVIELPVFDESGKLLRTDYEQTTYLEWLNSDFTGQPCQSCHMPGTYHGEPNNTKIAYIEDETFPEVDNRLPDADITLPVRKTVPRHTLYGANVFLNEMFQQYPVLLGIRQLDYMIAPPVGGLITAREAALEMVRKETAEVKIKTVTTDGESIVAEVTIRNLAGHHLPSGVGFRRVFIEFLVLDGNDRPIWASGATSPSGVILDGRDGSPLDTEFLENGRYQQHHQVIDKQNQVQIYEELHKDSAGQFTTSFIHLVTKVKENRLPPKGWREDHEYARATEAKGEATHDPAYRDHGAGLSGTDTIRYKVTLAPQDRSRAAGLEVTAYYQAIPPYYLKHRFDSALVGRASTDTKRLYYLASRLNTRATDRAGDKFMEGWKLRLTSDRVELDRSPATGANE